MRKEREPLERRAFKRVPTYLPVKLRCNGSFHYGIIINLSENGMCITTGIRLPCGVDIDIAISLPDGRVLEVFGVFNRLMKVSGLYNGICVEILDPPDHYLDLVDNYKAVAVA